MNIPTSPTERETFVAKVTVNKSLKIPGTFIKEMVQRILKEQGIIVPETAKLVFNNPGNYNIGGNISISISWNE